MRKFIGCGTALVTPFDKNGAIDHKAFRKLITRQINSQINFLVPLGTTGEAACLSDQEKILLLELCFEETQGKIPIVAGIGSNSTKSVMDNIKLFKNIPLDGFLVVTPYYNKPTQNGLYHHFKAIAEATDKPIIIYNVPGRTAVNLSASTTLKLAEISNIVAVKEASSNYAQISQIIKNAPKNFTVLSGNDNETLPLMVTGASGVISVASNIAPKEIVALTKACLKNDYKNACKIHHKLSDLFEHCFIETNPIPVKAAMHKMKLIQNVLRSPLYPATAETISTISNTIKQLGLHE